MELPDPEFEKLVAYVRDAMQFQEGDEANPETIAENAVSHILRHLQPHFHGEPRIWVDWVPKQPHEVPDCVFWVVWSPEGRTNSRYLFTKYDKAVKAAQNMAKREGKGRVFYVLECKSFHQQQLYMINFLPNRK